MRPAGEGNEGDGLEDGQATPGPSRPFICSLRETPALLFGPVCFVADRVQGTSQHPALSTALHPPLLHRPSVARVAMLVALSRAIYVHHVHTCTYWRRNFSAHTPCTLQGGPSPERPFKCTALTLLQTGEQASGFVPRPQLRCLSYNGAALRMSCPAITLVCSTPVFCPAKTSCIGHAGQNDV